MVKQAIKGFLYILKNEITNRYYVGSTNNINRRLAEHLRGKIRTTKVLGTYTLVYQEVFETIEEARAREKKLKSYKSKKYIDWLVSKYLRV